MPLRRLVIASCLLGACAKGDPPAAAVDESPEARRKAECERFATEMARTSAIAGQVLVTALDDDPESARRGRDEMKAGAQQIRRELLDKCMQWPEEVMACLPPLGILKDGCEERLLAAMDDAKPAPEHVPPGPAPAWSMTLPSEPRGLAMTSDGTMLLIGDELMAVRDGKVAWRKEGFFDRWVVQLPGESSTWVVGRKDQVLAIDPVTGNERWSATLPADGAETPSEGEPDDVDTWVEKANVQAIARHGDVLLVGDGEARFFRINPARCAAGAGSEPAKGCVTFEARLPDEILEDDAQLFADGNERYLWESGIVRAFTSDWRTLMTARAHDTLSQVVVSDGRLVLIVDDELVELDPTQCRGEAPFAPSDWPQPGALVFQGSDECEECQAPPPGCRRSRAYYEDITGETPALLEDGAVVVHEGGYTLALHDGKPRWKVSTGGGGPLATDGARVLGFSTGLHEGDAPGVFEVAADDGELRWRTVLPVEVGEIYLSDDIRLALGGAWLAAAYEGTVFAIPLPPA